CCDSRAIGGFALSGLACQPKQGPAAQGRPAGASPPPHVAEKLPVYILVVPLDVVGPERNGLPLNGQELQAAESYVKSQATKLNLKPTSIIAVRDKPASFVTVGPNQKLVSHDPSGVRETVLHVWTESDTIEWQSDRPFEITRVAKAGPPQRGTQDTAPENPFKSGFPYSGLAATNYRVQSSQLSRSPNNRQYKTSTTTDAPLSAPAFRGGAPPPP